MTELYPDIRQLVLNGEVKAKQQAIYIERLGGWLNIRELLGDERAALLQSSINMKTGVINLGLLYAGLVVHSLRYPHPDVVPEQPIPPDPPAENATEAEISAYEREQSAYYQDLANLKKPYPKNHPKAGERVFQPNDRDAMSKALPGQIIESIALPAFALSGLRQEDVDQEKKVSKSTVVDSTITTSPNGSTATTLANS